MNATLDRSDSAYVVYAGMKVDGDGSPHCYAPANSGLPALDYLANAGHPGNWWGVVTNAEGQPYVQGKDAPAYDDSSIGFYVSSTTYERKEFHRNDPHRYLNSETERFVVVPSSFRKSVPGIVMGCLVLARYQGREATGVVGDIGPDFGEASIAFAKALGINADPKHGGVDTGVEYRIYPGVKVDGYELQRA